MLEDTRPGEGLPSRDAAKLTTLFIPLAGVRRSGRGDAHPVQTTRPPAAEQSIGSPGKVTHDTGPGSAKTTRTSATRIRPGGSALFVARDPALDSRRGSGRSRPHGLADPLPHRVRGPSSRRGTRARAAWRRAAPGC